MIRLTAPSIDDTDIKAVLDVLESGSLVQGPRVGVFERAIAQYVGTQHSVAVSSGTAALHLALLALGVGPDDIVVTTAYSHPATANVIELCGARPVFVDIQQDSYNLDPTHLDVTVQRLMSRAETSHRVKAIVPVHTFGQLADMPAVVAIANKYELPIVEDAACALGATLHDRQAGTWGVSACFSLHPRKAITAGEGGIITTNDAVLAHRLKTLRNHGQDPDAAPGTFILPGYNYRLTDLQGALALAQLAKLDRIIAARRRLAAVYNRLLTNVPITPPATSAHSNPTYQSYVGLLAADLAAKRDDLIHEARGKGIETTIGTWHIPLTPYYRHKYAFTRGLLPVADTVFARAISLPLYEHLSIRDQEAVVETLVGCLTELGARGRSEKTPS